MNILDKLLDFLPSWVPIAAVGVLLLALGAGALELRSAWRAEGHARRPFPRRHPAARALHPGRGPHHARLHGHTIARQLGIPFEQADEMAVAAAKAGLVRHEVDTVTLTGEGQARGATLTAPIGVRRPRATGRPRRAR
jgi:hypothetical protein